MQWFRRKPKAWKSYEVGLPTLRARQRGEIATYPLDANLEAAVLALDERLRKLEETWANVG